MEASEEILQVLTELRDLEREHLAEYRQNVAVLRDMQERSLAIQAKAVSRQKRFVLLYFGMVVLLILLLIAMPRRRSEPAWQPPRNAAPADTGEPSSRPAGFDARSGPGASSVGQPAQA